MTWHLSTKPLKIPFQLEHATKESLCSDNKGPESDALQYCVSPTSRRHLNQHLKFQMPPQAPSDDDAVEGQNRKLAKIPGTRPARVLTVNLAAR